LVGEKVDRKNRSRKGGEEEVNKKRGGGKGGKVLISISPPKISEEIPCYT
jgi:hypothetical protein